MEITSLTTQQGADMRMSVQAVREQINAIQHLMKEALQGPTKDHPEGVHYGIVPGTNKPSLLKPGAEKIAMMFRLIPKYEMERTDLMNGHREYHCTCTLIHGPSGMIAGQGVGSASTMESKYRYRGAGGRACPTCGAMACKPSKKEFGGGFYCDKKAGGCDARFKPGSEECKTLDSTTAIKTENPDPADQYNTVLKMAQKRAQVAAVLTATAASDIFTQDIEDGTTDAGTIETRPPVQEPQAKKTSPSAAADKKAESGNTFEAVLEDVIVKTGKKKNGQEFTRYGLKVGSDILGTFDTDLGGMAVELKGVKVRVTWVPDGDFKNLVGIEPVGAVTTPVEDLPL